ncbi:MAG: S8 family serine peptidase [Planctomycetota bacterium]|nr:S8 family serine peptidase [Planctomycetota bacterium]
MSTPRLTTYTGSLALAVCVLMLSAGDALAGSWGDAWRAWKQTESKLHKTARKGDPIEQDNKRYKGTGDYTWAKNKKSTVGGIDPTNVPLVDGDFSLAPYWPRDLIEAPAANKITKGKGAVVAILDGGFDLEHPDIVDRLAPRSYDAVDQDYDAHDMGNFVDDDGDGIVDNGAGHGTFVASMVLLAAPRAKILPVRVRDDEGWGTNEELIRGLLFARAMGADVINLSLSAANVDDQEVLDLIEELCMEDDIPVVVSAGNDGWDIAWNELAISNHTLPVGASDKDDVLAPFSNWSWTNSMVTAPGVDVYGAYGHGMVHGHAQWSGCSFATGLVSGGVALVRCAHPHLTPMEIYAHLRQTSDAITSEWGWAWSVAFGRINLHRAVTEAP